MNFFITGFIKSAVFVSIFILFIMGLKHTFRNKISDYWNFKMWYVLLFAMALPLFPADFLVPFINKFNAIGAGNTVPKAVTGGIMGAKTQGNILSKDFYVSVNKIFTDDFYKFLTVIYLIGVIAAVILAVKNYLKIKNILKYSLEPDKNIKSIFDKSLNCFGIKNSKAKLVLSEDIKSPFATGLINHVVVFPFSYNCLSEDEISYIMLHEVGHLKSRDILNCFAICFFQIVYWFNPIVYMGLREMKSEMEIRCDRLVIDKIGFQKAKNYGLTIIKSAQNNLFEPRIRIYAAFGANKELLKRRIESIACTSLENKKSRFKSTIAFLLVLVFGICQMPFAVNAYGFDDYQNIKDEKIVLDDLSCFFQDYEGCFVLYSPDEDIYHVYNADYAKKRISPNSTYKIYSAVISLQEGIITPENSYMKWDGNKNPFELWNMDQDLNSAMENSVNWYFNILNEKIGNEKISKYLNMINYGNKDISGGDNFYLESSLKISAMEQAKILSNLFNGVYNFDNENIDAVKNAMTISENNGSVLYGKTGTGNVNGKNVNGSFTGCVENNGKEYFFAVNLYSNDNATGIEAYKKALEILNYKGLY